MWILLSMLSPSGAIGATIYENERVVLACPFHPFITVIGTVTLRGFRDQRIDRPCGGNFVNLLTRGDD